MVFLSRLILVFCDDASNVVEKCEKNTQSATLMMGERKISFALSLFLSL